MLNALIGGALVGLAASIMLIFNGRVTGITGIISGLVFPKKGDTLWRFVFILGLLCGGVILKIMTPDVFQLDPRVTLYDYALGGFLVGFGTLVGSGCTSGHGICGISRLSFRSILATFVFVSFGILSLFIFNLVRGGA